MYYRLYTNGQPAGNLAPEGFALFTCDIPGCRATVAAGFTQADRYPMAIGTEAATAAGWALLGADDRCPAHRPPAPAVSMTYGAARG